VTVAWRRPLAALLVLALAGWEPFRAPDPDVEAGNRAYAEGRYDDALAAYDRAARRGAVDGDGLAFDRGTAELGKAAGTKDPGEKRRLTERAIEDLKQAARARDPHIRAGANYNRGNALMEQDKLDGAIEAYKQALREDPELDDARLNLELALRRRQKQQQRQQQQQGQGQGQGQQGQQGQGQQGQGQSQGQGPQGQQGQGQSGGSDQNGSNGQGSNQGSNDQGSAQGSNQSGSNGQGSNQDGSNGQGSNQDGSNGQGSNQNGSNDQGARRPDDQNGASSNGQPPRGRPQHGRANPRSPRTPTDGKLDDLDNFSRRLQKDRARRHATGRPSDPQRDW
jgi:hypothetical protein